MGDVQTQQGTARAGLHVRRGQPLGAFGEARSGSAEALGPAVTADPDPRAAHRRLVEATVRQCSPDAVVSHMSAAVLHDLPIFTDALERVSLTRDRPGGGARRRYVRVYGGQLPAADITDTVGSASRPRRGPWSTWRARCRPSARSRSATRRSAPDSADAELAESLARAGQRHGIGAARRAIAMLDPRSESVGESASRVVFRDHGIPNPQPQFVIVDGSFSARADFAWPELRNARRVRRQAQVRGSRAGGKEAGRHPLGGEDPRRPAACPGLAGRALDLDGFAASDRPGPPAARRLRARLSALTATSAWSPYVCMGMGCLHGQ